MGASQNNHSQIMSYNLMSLKLREGTVENSLHGQRLTKSVHLGPDQICNFTIQDIDLNSKKEVPHEFKVAYNASLKSKINFLTKTDLEQIKDVRMLKIFRDSIRSHIQSVRLTPLFMLRNHA